MRPASLPTIAIVCAAAVSLALLPGPAVADVELTLKSGETFNGRGVDYQREEGIYVIELLSGVLLPIPAELVRGLRLTGGDAPAPTGINISEPETLAGAIEPELPRPSEQLHVFEGRASRFRRNIISPFWQPSSDWDMSPSRNNFNPARWYQAPIDFNWTPRSAFSAADDVTEFSPVRWYIAPISFDWVPEDGFAPR